MKYFFWFSLVLLIFVRYFTTLPNYKNGDRLRISGPVLSDPRTLKSSQYLKLSGIKVYLPKYPQVDYGDFLTVEGIFNDGEISKAKLVKREERKVILSFLRNRLISFYGRNLPEPQAGLVSGILLGSKGSVLTDFYDMSKNAGVAHVIVASGTNITFVASFLMSVFILFIPRQKSILFVILGIILYLFIAGFDAPLIRASIMSLFIFLGEEIGHLASKWRIFFLTILIMLAINPRYIEDLVFILSLASTASLMLFEKRVANFFKKVPSFLKEGLSTSFAAQIGVAPILYITFGQFNPLSPLVNAAVLWTIAPIMIIGMVSGVLSLVFEPVARIILYLDYPMLLWFTFITELFNK
jgi:competence protein ComEC